MSKNNLFTISITRQFGSLGRPIAKRLAELLDVEYYDRDIVEKTAEQLNLPVSTVNDREESAKAQSNRFWDMMFPLGKGNDEVQDKIFEAQQNIIRFLAGRESCIIVGRCSDYALMDKKNCTSVYIYSSYEHRLENCSKDLKLDEKEAKKMIAAVDEAREQYHLKYAGFKPNDERYKDLMIDSSYLGVEGTAQLLAEVIRKKYNLECEEK